MKRITALLLVFLFCGMICLPCSAEENNYIISDDKTIPISTSYVNDTVLYDFGGRLNSAQDLFIDSKDNLYIADTGNNRVIVCKANSKDIIILDEADGLQFNKPEGVFVDDSGGIYIADTGNERILHFSATGKYVESFIRPESDYLGETYLFNPSKVIVNSTGYLYTIKSQTIMTIDANNEFRGYLGQPDVGFNLSEALIRIFASDEQLKALKKREAEPYINFTIGKDGLIYATSREIGSEIKVLNSVGENLYRSSTAAETTLFNKIQSTFFSLFNIGNYASKSFQFGETVIRDGKQSTPLFTDIAVDGNGIITVVNSVNGMLYQYDNEGSLLCSFGKKESDSGKIELPSSLAVDSKGNIYLLDAVQNHILVFSPTAFIKNVHNAVSLYNDGDYSAAYDIWESIAQSSENYELAQIGMGKALYKEKNYYEAMQQYKKANERVLYSQAYAKYRHDIFRQNFGWVLLGILAIIAVLVLLLRILNKTGKKGIECFGAKYSGKKTLWQTFLLSCNTIIHPIDTFRSVKENRDRLNLFFCVISFVCLLLIRVISLYCTGYPMMTADTGDINIWLECLKLGLPVATWGLSVFFVTSILDGESKVGEVYTCCIFSMAPFVMLTPLFTLLSQILSRKESGLYNSLQAIMWVWILILLIVSVYMLNNYSFGKTMAVCAISVLIMALIWAIAFLFIAIISEVWGFVFGIGTEIRLML